MTNEELDILWFKAMRQSVEEDKAFIRYHFAALVAAAERERLDLNAIHSCHAECQNPFCVRVREAVAHEREACAMEAEYEAARWPYAPEIREPCEEIAKAIRARGVV